MGSLSAYRGAAANPAFTGDVLKSADYDALGRMKTIEVGKTVGGAALVTNTDTYDATNARLTRVLGTVPSSTPLDRTVAFDGLGGLTSQTGTLGAEAVSRSYTYDGLSRLKTAVGPWEKATGATGAVLWTYSYDALGNLRGQASTRSPANLADTRSWSYGHTTKPHFLSAFAQQNQPTETLAATTGGEVSTISRPSLPTETLVWNAIGKLSSHKSSSYSYDAFGELTQTVTGPSGGTTSIVSVGEDFEYDIGALRSNKFFSIQGVRIASVATSYTAPSASVPPALRILVRFAEPLAARAAAALLALGLLSLASLTLRRRTPVWLSLPGVGVLSFTLVALPYTAHAATLTSGPGAYGRHGEPILAYLVDHLGTIRGAANQAGVVVETRDYAPFGESIAHSGTFAVQHRFTGQPQDDQAGGFYNYGARFYNPKWGRFVSPDEMVQGFDSQGLNPFTYVLNRPTSGTDPTGEFLAVPAMSIPSLAAMQAGMVATPPNPSSEFDDSRGAVVWPTDFRVVIRPFKLPEHDGMDIRARKGTSIYAAADGEVIAVYSKARGGGQVKIKHRDGSVTGYAHLAPSVKEGQRVEAGDPIGKSDGSGGGKGFTGPHLHFTFRASGSSPKSDPAQMIGAP